MPVENKKYYIKTFGCQMNERDSEIMSQSLLRNGYVAGSDIELADCVIVNTCSIRGKAEQKALSLLGYLRKIKDSRPGMKIVVAGCVAQQEAQSLVERMPYVDLVVGTQHIYDIPQFLLGLEDGGTHIQTDLESDYTIPRFLPAVPSPSLPEETQPFNEFQFSRFVTIMQGCNNYCTYCVVPYTRGREVSRLASHILEEARLLVASGVKEITLLGQNVNSYGKTNTVSADGGPYFFADLLREVSEIEGLQRLRFTTSNPKDLTDELMSCFRDIENLCPHFHLPVQSGSNAVLQAMNRRYTVEQYLEKVNTLHKYCPSIAISTDIIVGFPGESDDDFEKTMELLETVRYHGSFSFKYSDRPGTRSQNFTGKVKEEVKSERLSHFQARQNAISLERNREYLGKIQKILVEKIFPDSIKGRTGSNHVVHLPYRDKVSLGDLLDVKITFAGKQSLKAIFTSGR